MRLGPYFVNLWPLSIGKIAFQNPVAITPEVNVLSSETFTPPTDLKKLTVKITGTEQIKPGGVEIKVISREDLGKSDFGVGKEGGLIKIIAKEPISSGQPEKG